MLHLFRTVNLNRDRWGSDSENSEAGTDRSSLSRDSARVLSQASASSKLANIACSEGENASRRRYPLINGCRSVNIFERLDRIEEGSYGIVYRARDLDTREVPSRVNIHVMIPLFNSCIGRGLEKGQAKSRSLLGWIPHHSTT